MITIHDDVDEFMATIERRKMIMNVSVMQASLKFATDEEVLQSFEARV